MNKIIGSSTPTTTGADMGTYTVIGLPTDSQKILYQLALPLVALGTNVILTDTNIRLATTKR